jgi:hypothetical protein
MNRVLRVTLVACWAIVGALDTWAQTNVDPQPLQYLTSFLDQAPTDAELARLPLAFNAPRAGIRLGKCACGARRSA